MGRKKRRDELVVYADLADEVGGSGAARIERRRASRC
jgi:hypothetical protein